MQFNIVIYNILSQNQKGGSGALGIQQPYPLPPNDKMKKSNKHHTYQKKIILT